MSVDWDVLIIGRSYSGLGAGLNLGRARRSVLVVGSGGPRNDSVSHVHRLITRYGIPRRDHRDGGTRVGEVPDDRTRR